MSRERIEPRSWAWLVLGRVLGALSAALVIGGCSTTTIDEIQVAPMRIERDEAVVMLGRRDHREYAPARDFIHCVGRSVAGGSNAIRVIPEKTFVDGMYPYFETSTAPASVKNLEALVRTPEVAHRFDEWNLRYLVWIDGSTETTNKQGGIPCTITPFGVGCFGFMTWDDDARYDVSIWDVKKLVLSSKISTDTQGTSYLPAVVIPVPLLARVQSKACRSTADQIERLLRPSAPPQRGAPKGSASARVGGAGIHDAPEPSAGEKLGTD